PSRKVCGRCRPEPAEVGADEALQAVIDRNLGPSEPFVRQAVKVGAPLAPGSRWGNPDHVDPLPGAHPRDSRVALGSKDFQHLPGSPGLTGEKVPNACRGRLDVDPIQLGSKGAQPPLSTGISYAVFCLKKKTGRNEMNRGANERALEDETRLKLGSQRFAPHVSNAI